MRILLLATHLLLVSILFAQSEQKIKLNLPEFYNPINIVPLSFQFDHQFTESNNFTLVKPTNLDTTPGLTLYQSKKTQLRNISFTQEKSEDLIIELGNYEHYKNSFTYNKNNKVLFDFEVGLIKQSTVQNFDDIDFHLSVRTLIEYKISKKISAYMYGQYITSPLNKTEISFNSDSYMNPLFLQTETGTGLKATYKNVKANVGMKSIYDTQFNHLKSINTMDTKITIGF